MEAWIPLLAAVIGILPGLLIRPPKRDAELDSLSESNQSLKEIEQDFRANDVIDLADLLSDIRLVNSMRFIADRELGRAGRKLERTVRQGLLAITSGVAVAVALTQMVTRGTLDQSLWSVVVLAALIAVPGVVQVASGFLSVKQTGFNAQA